MEKINLAYKKVIAYDENNKPHYITSNFDNYDIHPWHTPTSRKLSDIEKEFNITFPCVIKRGEQSDFAKYMGGFLSQDLSVSYNQGRFKFELRELDEIIKTDEFFIYPIMLYDIDIFKKFSQNFF